MVQTGLSEREAVRTIADAEVFAHVAKFDRKAVAKVVVRDAIRAWLRELDDEQLASLGLTPEDILVLRH